MRVPTVSPRASTRVQQEQRTRPANLREVELDVREDLRMKREPFSRIMTVAGQLGERDVLHLRAIFEPFPLYNVLGKKGFVHQSEMHADDDWSVWFWKESGVADNEAVARVVADETAGTSATNEVVLDVRGLEAPEPMVQTLVALETLPQGHTLVHVNVRVPQFLLPILDERGFTYQVAEEAADRVVMRISRVATPSSSQSGSQMAKVELDVRVIPPRDKHPTIFRTFDELSAGESMVIVNDHDPRPLRYQLAAERANQFEWTYLEAGPETWRVKIDRTSNGQG